MRKAFKIGFGILCLGVGVLIFIPKGYDVEPFAQREGMMYWDLSTDCYDSGPKPSRGGGGY